MRKLLGDKIEFESSSYASAKGADALALVTEWHEFRRPNFERLKSLMRQPVLFDGRNIWNPGRAPRRRLHVLRHGPRHEAQAELQRPCEAVRKAVTLAREAGPRKAAAGLASQRRSLTRDEAVGAT